MKRQKGVDNPKTKLTAGSRGNVAKKKKQENDEKAGKKKKAQSRYKDPSKMCWDPFPLFSYDVKEVNKTNKHILLVITSILWCFSVVTVCVGAYLIIQRKSREKFISAGNFSSFWLDFSLVLLCNGMVSSIVTFCGLVGVLRENVCLIRVFYISLIVVLLLKFSLAVFVFVFADYSRPLLERMLAEQALVDYRASSGVERMLDYLQTTFHCCGLRDDSFQDWSRNIYFNCSTDNPSSEQCGVPWSCCRNDTGLSNPLCGLGVQKMDRNIASRTIYTMGCLHAIQNWVISHAIVAGLLVLLEVSAIVAVTFQCTRMVNELQMMNGVYRGPWWDRICASRRSKSQKQRKTQPPSSAAVPPPSPQPGPSERRQSTEPPSEVDTRRTKLPSVVRIGHGPAVRRTKAAAPAGQSGDPSSRQPSTGPSRWPGETSNVPPDDAAKQKPSATADHYPHEAPSEPSSYHEPPTVVVVSSDGRVLNERVLSPTLSNVADTKPDQTKLVHVGEMLDTAAEQSYFCRTDSPQAGAAADSGDRVDSAETVDSEGALKNDSCILISPD